MKLSQIKNEPFKLDLDCIDWYIKSIERGKNGRKHCKCYSPIYGRIKHLDRYLKPSKTVFPLS